MEIERILRIVTKDRAYYAESGGGVTLSGGEPMYQYAGTKALLLRLKEEGVSAALDTTGYADQDKFMNVCRYADVVLFDLKHMDRVEHKRITGVDNTIIHDNLRKIAAEGKNIIVRYPMIKRLNDGEENISQMCLLLKEIGIQKLDVIPYHDIGLNKYSSLGRQAYGIDAYTDEEIENNLSRIRSFGIVPDVI
jgi:pyruvate formate lyase activating enzyme